MKRILFLFFVVQFSQSPASFAQLKADWTFYGTQFGYGEGKMNDKKINIVGVTDFKILKDGSFIFSSQSGITVFKDGSVSELNKVLNVNGSVKAGMKLDGTLGISVDKNNNLFFRIDRRLFMIDSKYFNDGQFKPDNLGEVPAKRLREEDGFIYKTVTALASDSKGNIWVRGDISDEVTSMKTGNVDFKNGVTRFDGAKWDRTDVYGTENDLETFVVFDENDYALMQFPQGKTANMIYAASGRSDEKVVSKGELLEVSGAVAMDYFKGLIYLANSNMIHVQKNGKWERVATTPLTNIVDIKVDKTGKIWIASNEGVTCINTNGLQYQLNTENSILPTNSVRKIVIDGQNKKWFMSDGGLVGYKEPADPKLGMSIYTKLNSNYFDGKIEGIESFDKGLLLLNSDYGLLRFDGANFKQETPSNLGGMFFNDLTVSKDGKAYIGTYRYLHEYDGKLYTKIEWKEDIGKQVTSVVTDDNNNVWIGFDGISKRENGTWQNFNKKNAGLSSNTVYKLFKDSKGNVWGVLSDGIVKYDGTTWTSFTKKTTDIGLRNMIGFAETKDGKVWFCNGSKLVESDGTVMKEVTNFKSVGTIRNMISQEDGSLLIATEEKGIAKVKDGNVTYFDQASGLPTNAISRIFKDKDNAIWVSFGFPPPAPSISSTFDRPTPGGAASPAPPPPSPKEIFTKKLQASDIQFGLVKLTQL